MPVSSSRPVCAHATLASGARCPGCGKLQSYLAAKGLLGSGVTSTSVGSGVAPPPTPSALERAWFDHPLFAVIRHRRRIGFFRQLHALLKAGEGMPVIFADLQRSATDPASRRAVEAMRAQIDAGATLGDAARFDPVHFDPVTLELFAAADASGTVVPMLQKLLDRMEEAQRLRWKLVVASLYPCYLIGALVLAGPLLDLPAIASKTGSADGLGAAYIAMLLRNLAMAAALFAAVIAFPLGIAGFGLSSRWDSLKRSLPLIGALMRDLSASRFCEAFASASRAGLNADRTLALAVRATSSPAVEERLPRAQEVLAQGGTFADAIASVAVLDGPGLGQFSTAERVGQLDDTMATLAREYGESSVRRLGVLTAALIVGTIGLGIAVIVAKIFGVVLGPINSLYTTMGGPS